MLSYAFQVLNEQGYKNIATEQFNNTGELMAAIRKRYRDSAKERTW
jgi:5-methylcytosine-specific restriction enzyme subunit McrC